jgi:hypothetical protein
VPAVAGLSAALSRLSRKITTEPLVGGGGVVGGRGGLEMLFWDVLLLRSSLGAARHALHCSCRSPSRAGASARRGVNAPTRMHGSAKLMRELQNLLPRADHTEVYGVCLIWGKRIQTPSGTRTKRCADATPN